MFQAFAKMPMYTVKEIRNVTRYCRFKNGRLYEYLSHLFCLVGYYLPSILEEHLDTYKRKKQASKQVYAHMHRSADTEHQTWRAEVVDSLVAEVRFNQKLLYLMQLYRNYLKECKLFGQQIPHCPTAWIYQDYPTLNPKTKVRAQPASVLCDFVLAKYDLRKSEKSAKIVMSVELEAKSCDHLSVSKGQARGLSSIRGSFPAYCEGKPEKRHCSRIRKSTEPPVLVPYNEQLSSGHFYSKPPVLTPVSKNESSTFNNSEQLVHKVQDGADSVHKNRTRPGFNTFNEGMVQGSASGVSQTQHRGQLQQCGTSPLAPEMCTSQGTPYESGKIARSGESQRGPCAGQDCVLMKDNTRLSWIDVSAETQNPKCSAFYSVSGSQQTLFSGGNLKDKQFLAEQDQMNQIQQDSVIPRVVCDQRPIENEVFVQYINETEPQGIRYASKRKASQEVEPNVTAAKRAMLESSRYKKVAVESFSTNVQPERYCTVQQNVDMFETSSSTKELVDDVELGNMKLVGVTNGRDSEIMFQEEFEEPNYNVNIDVDTITELLDDEDADNEVAELCLSGGPPIFCEIGGDRFQYHIPKDLIVPTWHQTQPRPHHMGPCKAVDVPTYVDGISGLCLKYPGPAKFTTKTSESAVRVPCRRPVARRATEPVVL